MFKPRTFHPRDFRLHPSVQTLNSALVRSNQSERRIPVLVLSREHSSLKRVRNFVVGHFDPAGILYQSCA